MLILNTMIINTNNEKGKNKMRHNFELYCKDYENIENYDKALADNFIGWYCHHRLQTWTSDGERRLVDISKAELIALDMYYNRPAEELVFLTPKEHNMLHNKGKTGPNKGKTPWNKGKPMSSVQKNKLSRIKKGKPLSENIKKKMSETRKGMYKCYHWYNNGKINKFCKECPKGFVPGRLKRK